MFKAPMESKLFSKSFFIWDLKDLPQKLPIIWGKILKFKRKMSKIYNKDHVQGSKWPHKMFRNTLEKNLC